MRTPYRLAGIAVVLAIALALGVGVSPSSTEGQEPLSRVRIEGRVLGPDGAPLEGILLRAFGHLGTDYFGPWFAAATDPDGDFSIETPDGSFNVELYQIVDGVECRLGYVSPDGSHTFPYDQVKRIAVSGESVGGLTVQLPDTPSALCRPIRGTVSGTDGQSIGRVSIAVDGIGPLDGVRANWATNEDGAFTLYGQPGSYNFLISTSAGQACTVVGDANAPPGVRAHIDVSEDGASDIRVVVSGQPSDDWRRSYCSFPPRMVTTELQPGWNLAGWTGDKVDASELFGAIPGLEVVHAWDAEEERFLTAAAGVPDKVANLRTLTPGMGLWLYLGGTDPVEWVRPFLPESGFVTLTGGWNLVAWSGVDGLAVDSALEALNAELRTAGAWDAGMGQALHYSPTEPRADNTLQRLALGSALWIDVSEDRSGSSRESEQRSSSARSTPRPDRPNYARWLTRP